jgi:hypothetical protein
MPNLFLYHEDFWRWYFGLCWNLEISCRVMISWRILISLRGFFWRLYFCMVKYFLSFGNSSFALRYFSFNIYGKACCCWVGEMPGHTLGPCPCFLAYVIVKRLCLFILWELQDFWHLFSLWSPSIRPITTRRLVILRCI